MPKEPTFEPTHTITIDDIEYGRLRAQALTTVLDQITSKFVQHQNIALAVVCNHASILLGELSKLLPDGPDPRDSQMSEENKSLLVTDG